MVLDLDHTLLHAVEAQSGGAIPPPGVYPFSLQTPAGTTMRYFARMRDGLHAFLRECARRLEPATRNPARRVEYGQPGAWS